jgi:hypothetical protein
MQVARRVRVLPPDTPLLSVRLAKGPAAAGGGGGDSGKVASGIEVAYTVAFRPESQGERLPAPARP